MDADILPLSSPEAVQNQIVEFDERLQQINAGPRITRVPLCCETAFGEVYADAFGAGIETASDIPLALVNEVVDEGCFGVTRSFACGM